MTTRQILDIRVERDPYEPDQLGLTFVFEGGVELELYNVYIGGKAGPPTCYIIRSHPTHARDCSGYISQVPGEKRLTILEAIQKASSDSDPESIPPPAPEPPGGLKRARRNYKNGRPPHK